MMWPVILKDGPHRNQTLATIKFNKFGDSTNQQIFICKEWAEGLTWAKQQGHTWALFVKSGTIITDWAQWKQLVDQYPHNGLIAHLIWPPEQQLYLDDQCWFMNVDNFEVDDFTVTKVNHPLPVRSDQNLHDNYTPLWVKPSDKQTEYSVNKFGQGLVARQLQHNRPIVNWNNSARDIKSYLYNNTIDWSTFQNYKNIAENQLWIFNNEPIVLVKKAKLVSPGSGLSWILNILDSATTKIQIVDISKVQIKFCQALWDTWTGTDYGNFVWNFIEQNNLVHYEFDNPNLTPLERLQLKSKTKFIEYVNNRVNVVVDKNFESQWSIAKQKKQVDFCNDNLINWVLANDIDEYDNIWCSNILDYKWTLLHTTVEQYEKFQEKICKSKK
jgi:hypothetical protein